MQAYNPCYDLVIAGGGLVGNCLAIALQHSGLRIALVEANSNDQLMNSPLGDRALALSAGTVTALDKLGIWQAVAGKATAIKDIHVSDRGHFGKARLSARKEHVEALGYVITARDIEIHVANLADNTCITKICPARVVGINSGEQYVEVDVKPRQAALRLTTKLLVGADGGNSSVRNLLGIGQKIEEYQQTALVTTVKTDLPHKNTAYERFTESGPLAFLPIDKTHCAVVWTRKNKDVEKLMALSDEGFLSELQACFGYRLGRFRLTTPRRAFPVSLIRAEHMQTGRSVIIGNAAHQLHPVAGQGFNLGLRDLIELSEMIQNQVDQNGDIGSTHFLTNYVKKRQQDHDRTITFTDTLVKLFSNESLLLAGARNLGLAIFDHTPIVKGLLSRHAMGLAQHLAKD